MTPLRLLLAVAGAVLLGWSASARAQTLADPQLSEPALASWIETFTQMEASGPKGVDVTLIQHLNTLNGWIQSSSDIKLFRDWPRDDEIVRGLVPLAGGNLSETRVPATLILGNVVDNTNVCYAIAHLANTPEISPSGRINLLQVVLQVARYAFADTAVWITTLAAQIRAELAQEQSVSKTIDILDRIDARLANRTNGQSLTLRTLDWSRFASCLGALPESYGGPADAKPLFEETVEALTVEMLQERLFSEDRREFATHLAILFDAADAVGRTRLVDTMLGAIIPQKQDPGRRYLVNLYIAVSFTRMAPGALTTDLQKQALLDLRNTIEYRDDPTFVQNVDQAIEKQGVGG
jgi:hypothetical protein